MIVDIFEFDVTTLNTRLIEFSEFLVESHEKKSEITENIKN